MQNFGRLSSCAASSSVAFYVDRTCSHFLRFAVSRRQISTSSRCLLEAAESGVRTGLSFDRKGVKSFPPLHVPRSQFLKSPPNVGSHQTVKPSVEKGPSESVRASSSPQRIIISDEAQPRSDVVSDDEILQLLDTRLSTFWGRVRRRRELLRAKMPRTIWFMSVLDMAWILIATLVIASLLGCVPPVVGERTVHYVVGETHLPDPLESEAQDEY